GSSSVTSRPPHEVPTSLELSSSEFLAS
ncbi:hypothetical protein A2U01_0086121, partial [Trifolium medium]|nr:hypothetical protein [Trifolium medium]